jgi:hypothetical protein
VQPADVLAFLVALAEEAGIAVRVLPRAAAGEGEPAPRSGACRMRGAPFLLLAPAEPVEDRIAAAAAALRRFAPQALEGRFLPPAVRARLEGPEPGGTSGEP